MGRSDYWKDGEWNAICDVCGQKWKASKIKKRWDGAMVCPKDWEPRHPQDFVRTIPDKPNAPWSNPESTDVFLQSCSTISAVAGMARSGCMTAGRVIGTT